PAVPISGAALSGRQVPTLADPGGRDVVVRPPRPRVAGAQAERSSAARVSGDESSRMHRKLLVSLAPWLLAVLCAPLSADPVGVGAVTPSPAVPGSSPPTCHLPPRTAGLSAAQWQEDVRAMIAGIERLHISPFHHTPKATLEQAAARLEAQIPQLPPEAIPVRMKQIVALVGDGHTRLVAPPQPIYPLQVYWF